jgi:hypothetical protein
VTLAELQAAFHALATRGAHPPAHPDLFLAGTRALPASERIAIYADMYRWRLSDALREDYPKLAALLGDERFLALAGAYARAHPPDRPDLGQHGRHLPAFLRGAPAPGRAELADLAALEWARTEVFLEAPATPVGREALSALRPEAFPRASLALVPALRILVLEHDAAAAWRRLERGEPCAPPAEEATSIVVWRAGFDVFHARVPLDEARALEAAREGAALASICAAFTEREDPARAAFAAIGSWLDEGWIAGVVAAPEPGGRAP